MKFRITSSVIFSAVALGAVFLQMGCASTGNQRSANTNNTMKAVEQDYIEAMAQVDITDGSLQSLIDEGQPDEKKAFDKYSNDVKRMESMGKRLFERADQMSAQQRNYFDEWRMQGNTYTDDRIQARSEQRRADLSEYFANISVASVGVRGSLKSYMSDIRQIRTYLSNDLTPKGVGDLTPTIQQAITDGSKLKDSVSPVLAAIGSARHELSQGGNQAN